MAFLNPLIGILAFISTWFTSFLFSGFFLPEDDVPWPLKVPRRAPAHATAAAQSLQLRARHDSAPRRLPQRPPESFRSVALVPRAQRGRISRAGAKPARGGPSAA